MDFVTAAITVGLLAVAVRLLWVCLDELETLVAEVTRLADFISEHIAQEDARDR